MCGGQAEDPRERQEETSVSAPGQASTEAPFLFTLRAVQASVDWTRPGTHCRAPCFTELAIRMRISPRDSLPDTPRTFGQMGTQSGDSQASATSGASYRWEGAKGPPSHPPSLQAVPPSQATGLSGLGQALHPPPVGCTHFPRSLCADRALHVGQAACHGPGRAVCG